MRIRKTKTVEPSKPWTIVLDIDGVLDPLGPIGHSDYLECPNDWAGLWRVPYSTIISLHGLKEYANFIWGTMWMDEAMGLSRMMHLPISEYVEFSDPGETDWIKLPAFIEYLRGRTDKVLIIDDEISEQTFAHFEDDGRVHLLKTDGALGLTEEDFEEIRKLLGLKTSSEDFKYH